jgi:hypothetical protein
LTATAQFLRKTQTIMEATRETKNSPFCAETILAEAIVCRYCGRDLNGSSSTQQKSIANRQDLHDTNDPEVTYLENEDVTITNSRAIIKGKTFAMANITSISLGIIPADKSGAFATGCMGVFFGLIAFGIGYLLQFTGGMIFGGVILVGAIAIADASAKSQKDKYLVNVGSASGETQAPWAYDREYIQKIVDAMNEAIVKRG